MGSATLKLAFVVVLFSAITCSSEDPKIPMAIVKDVDFKDFDHHGISLLFKLAVTNPFEFSIPVINNIEYFLKSDNRLIVGGNYTSPPELKPNGNTPVRVEISVPANVLISLIRDLAPDLDFDYEIGMRFKVHLPVVGEFDVPITHKGHLKLLTWKTMFLGL